MVFPQMSHHVISQNIKSEMSHLLKTAYTACVTAFGNRFFFFFFLLVVLKSDKIPFILLFP